MAKGKQAPAVPEQGQRVAFVTGASSGIGKAVAEIFAKNGIAVIACGRRADRLEALRQDLAGRAPVLPLVFDVSSKDAVQHAVQSIPSAWRNVNILVNNAGNAHGLDPIQEGKISDWDEMIDLNIKGLLYVSRAVIPLMPTGADSGSIVINVGSIAGREAYPAGGVYGGTKAAVDQITRGMKLDLYKQGIRVAVMAPGLVATEFSMVRFKGDKSRADKVYEGVRTLTAYDCADAILYMATRPPHCNVADMLLMPTDQAAARDLIRKPSKL